MQVQCPHCGQEVEVDLGPEAQLAHCPYCNESMEIPAMPTDGTIIDDRPPDAREPREVDDLRADRIKQVSKMRRAAYRSRSWFLIGAVGCLACFGQFLWNGITLVVHPSSSIIGSYLISVAWVMVASVAAWGVWWMWRRAEQYRVEASRSALEEPDERPDFTTLSDGSQTLRNLHEMGRRGD